MRYSLSFILLFSFYWASAQYGSVVFNYEMGYFNNGQPLPAEERLLFSGEVSESVVAIEVKALKPNGKKALYAALWQRAEGNRGENFQLPFNYRLQANASYDVAITYYELVDRPDKAEINRRILKNLEFYQTQFIKIQKGKLRLEKSAKKLKDDLDQILQQGLQDYRPAVAMEATAYSDLVQLYLESLEKDTTVGSADELVDLLARETKHLLEGNWWKIYDARKVNDYPTEKLGGKLAVNVGYGGVIFNTDPENFSYGAAPYIGLSLPLSNRAYSPALLRNASLSLGAFTQNLEDSEKNTFTGPIFGRPYFVGIGYNIFRFIRLNAGAVALEELNNGGSGLQLDRIQLQPFVGLSAEIKFSVGLGR
ncbi:MAG: hypothetical protein AAFP89_18235 [Bacteroidota bacterium]